MKDAKKIRRIFRLKSLAKTVIKYHKPQNIVIKCVHPSQTLKISKLPR